MTTKNILCAYNGANTAISSLRYAIQIAKHHDGWLTGIVRYGRPVLERRFGGQFPREVIETMHKNDADRIASVVESFEQETETANMADRTEFLKISGEEDIALGELSRTFDLIVTGVPDQDISVEHLTAHPDMIALQSGRPVLVVPDDYFKDGLADHALVAWDGKRSAARAIGDAMSILEEKAKVSVVCVGKTAPENTDWLMKNLAHHGINADLIVRAKHQSVGQTVLDASREIGAQLIVMGAYEHSKFSHDLFGGATTDVIAESHIPVFMSH